MRADEVRMAAVFWLVVPDTASCAHYFGDKDMAEASQRKGMVKESCSSHDHEEAKRDREGTRCLSPVTCFLQLGQLPRVSISFPTMPSD